jgi:RNA polymerase sigma factor (sigma-70 family)
LERQAVLILDRKQGAKLAININESYRKYGPMVLRRCRRLLKNEEMAVDAMHDVFVQLLRNESRLDFSRPASLLQRIATNICLNRLRGQQRRPESPEEELLLKIATADDMESIASTRSLLGRIFKNEKKSTHTIAVLHWVDGFTLEEVAKEMGLSVSGIRKRLRTLQSRVGELEGV